MFNVNVKMVPVKYLKFADGEELTLLEILTLLDSLSVMGDATQRHEVQGSDECLQILMKYGYVEFDDFFEFYSTTDEHNALKDFAYTELYPEA